MGDWSILRSRNPQRPLTPFHGYQVTTVSVTVSNQTTLEIGVSILEFGSREVRLWLSM